MVSGFSESEENGLTLISKDCKMVFSPGMSTGGRAEIRMILDNSERRIVATTIDEKGLEEVKNQIKQLGLSKRIELRLEDVQEPLQYSDNSFDFIYARLILHYLKKHSLDKTLKEFHRVLKPKSRLFIVVRSNKCPEASLEGATYDEESCLTSYPAYDDNGHLTGNVIKRYFHSIESITHHVENSGFKVIYAKEYEERLFKDFMRRVPSFYPNYIIELLALK